MMSTRKILVIAGTREAHEILHGLVARGREVVATLPEAERDAPDLPVPVNPRRFASADGFRAWLSAQNPTHVVDAGHAFEDDMSRTAAAFCAERGVPYLRVLRPAWEPDKGYHWIRARSVAEAAALVPPGGRAFSNTGRATQADFKGFRGDVLYLRRLAEPSGAPPFEFMHYSVGLAPFSVEEEKALFRDLKIDHLITRNVGGAASQSKLIAAQALGLNVIMIARPDPPDAPVVETAQAALDWEDTQ